jgi:DNA-binding MarR family transcriptional regulator
VNQRAETFRREESPGYMTNLAARSLEQALHRRIAPYGVVPGQFAQLLALYERDGQTQAELCEEVRIEQPTMARTLARMERDGLIERRPDPTDRRRVLIFLTERAWQLRAGLYAAAEEVNALATRGQDRQALLQALAAIVTNLQDNEPRARARRSRARRLTDPYPRSRP